MLLSALFYYQHFRNQDGILSSCVHHVHTLRKVTRTSEQKRNYDDEFSFNNSTKGSSNFG